MSWMDLARLVRANPPSKKEIAQGLEYQRRKGKVSFYVDENFPTAATRLLKSMRARVTTVQEAKLRRHPDENHTAHALKNGFVLLTCDRDYLDERRFPLIHCPAIVVFNFGSGSIRDVARSFACLETIIRIPQFYDKWMKIDANPDSWTEYARFLNGTTSRTRYRIYQGRVQQWIDGPLFE